MTDFQVDFSDAQPKFRRPELLTHPNIPATMSGVNPRTILGRKWWDVQRRIAYAENNYFCWACGKRDDDKPLEAHEAYQFDYDNHVMTLGEVVALCSDCHAFIHSGRLWVQYKQGRCSKKRVADIICPRCALLRQHNLVPACWTAVIALVVCEHRSAYNAWRASRAYARPAPLKLHSTKWRLAIGDKLYDTEGMEVKDAKVDCSV